MADQNTQLTHDEDEINLLDYWRVIWKYKWLIGVLCSTSVIAAMVFGLLAPKIYVSTATILIPKETGGGGFLSALGAKGIAQQITGLSLPSLTPNLGSVSSTLTIINPFFDTDNFVPPCTNLIASSTCKAP